MIETFIEKIKPHIKGRDINTIYEVGSRDCLQAIEFNGAFPSAKVISFEPNPYSIQVCKQNIANHPNIQLVEKAVSNHNGIVKFFPISISQSPIWNPGASSMKKITPLYKTRENLIQEEIEVPCVRLDTWILDSGHWIPDLLWIDAQGMTLEVIKGLGNFLNGVYAINFEAEMQEMYEGEALFPEIHEYLTLNGFTYVHGNTKEKWFTDFIYVNSQIYRPTINSKPYLMYSASHE